MQIATVKKLIQITVWTISRLTTLLSFLKRLLAFKEQPDVRDSYK